MRCELCGRGEGGRRGEVGRWSGAEGSRAVVGAGVGARGCERDGGGEARGGGGRPVKAGGRGQSGRVGVTGGWGAVRWMLGEIWAEGMEGGDMGEGVGASRAGDTAVEGSVWQRFEGGTVGGPWCIWEGGWWVGGARSMRVVRRRVWGGR